MIKSDYSPEYYCVKELLPEGQSEFQKWNDNIGYVNKKKFSELLHAFSHWTYEVTKSYMLVVDLQGVEREGHYLLTDPTIHGEDPGFGSTNLGELGMTQFFKTHECCSVCKEMHLKENNNVRSFNIPSD